jgi:hypothetical protein
VNAHISALVTFLFIHKEAQKFSSYPFELDMSGKGTKALELSRRHSACALLNE